jgi:peptidoglycan-N-acetylglucosamine deacetylase
MLTVAMLRNKYRPLPRFATMYLSFTPRFLQQMFTDYLWHIDGESKTIYLTFDDGPIPEVTNWVLDQLNRYDAKASFFCVGQNIERYPEIFQRIKLEGHTVGNHTFNHLSGWSTDNLEYISNVRKGARISGSKWFRPPYGKLKPSQTRFLKHHYRIVMWDVLSGDFDPNIGQEDCYQNVIKNTIPGSIIVFHDSLKAWKTLENVLPRVLSYFRENGFKFSSLEMASSSYYNPVMAGSITF